MLENKARHILRDVTMPVDGVGHRRQQRIVLGELSPNSIASPRALSISGVPMPGRAFAAAGPLLSLLTISSTLPPLTPAALLTMPCTPSLTNVPALERRFGKSPMTL
jgi:hypothetical protein